MKEIYLGNGLYKGVNMRKTKEVDYINAHGTSTKKGDEIELNAIIKMFKNNNKIN